jgi:hypothetical protein
MKFWTILWITMLDGDLKGSQSYLIYPDRETCVEAHFIVLDTLPYDVMARCEETDTPSYSPRPKKNPRY